MKTQISKWLIVIATFVSLMFVVTGLEAGKPTDKPDNPNKPPKSDQPEAECIVFTEDLIGTAVVEGGCCSDAGPFPAYYMTLNLKDKNGDTVYEGGPYDGQLFMNYFGAGRNHGYQVQFWTWDRDATETPEPDDICFEAIGGVIENDKKNKVLTVRFDGEEAYFCEEAEDGEGKKIFEIFPIVNFVLRRTSDLTECE
jgi:hypothetical protein